MYTITKEFRFEASHTLETLPEGHKCRRLHGHSYRVIVALEAQVLDDHGFVVDFAILDDFKRWIDSELDHRHLNSLSYFKGGWTSAEFIAEYCYDTLAQMLSYSAPHVDLVWCQVWETAKASATYRRATFDPPLPTKQEIRDAVRDGVMDAWNHTPGEQKGVNTATGEVNVMGSLKRK